MNPLRPDRRSFLARGAALAGASLLAGCDRLASMPWFKATLDRDDDANRYVQRLLLSEAKLAPEFTEAEISPWFKPNGTESPKDAGYRALAASNFASFKLEVGGLVNAPTTFSLADLRQMPARTQITRHDCVEGWSCIGKWTGVPMRVILDTVGLKPQARYVVFRCADTMESGGLDSGDDTDDPADTSDTGDSGSAPADAGAQGNGADAKGKSAAAGPTADGKAASAGAGALYSSKPDDPVRYYESLDLDDAFHPQTILAYELNGKALGVDHGAPLRLRVERQLGYKMAKYVMRIDLVDSLDKIGEGKGGYWEDQGYEWYAGI